MEIKHIKGGWLVPTEGNKAKEAHITSVISKLKKKLMMLMSVD